MKQFRFITTRLEISMVSGEVLRHEGYWYDGHVEECKGSDAQEKEEAASSQAFSQQLMQDYSTQFANQTGIVDSLKTALQPVLNAGPNQYGYSDAENAALRTQATTGTSNNYRSAKQALEENQDASGGGNTFLGSGEKAQENEELGSAAAQNESNQQLGITTAGYDTGRAQFNNATAQSENLAGIINPTGYSGAAISGNNQAFGQADEINKQNNAASPWNVVGGILGGAVSSVAGGLTGGLAKGFSGSESGSGTSDIDEGEAGADMG